ncbi:MAG: hypothetical protein U0T85_06700 [Cloacibacterium normanense]
MLEPAGYIPYFSGLKAIDEVGLVDKEIQTEIKKDKANYWKNTVEKGSRSTYWLLKIYLAKEKMEIFIKKTIDY